MDGVAVNKRLLIGVCFFLLFAGLRPHSLEAGGRKDIKTVTQEGQEIWEAEFDIGRLKTGKHNVIVYAKDSAGNLAIDGPYNIRVDPKAGLPMARVIFPENNSVIRAETDVVGVATGRFGISHVLLRFDNGPTEEVEGTDYWSYHFNEPLSEGKHTISVMAYDSKDTPGPFHTISYILDKTPPEVEITSHKTGDFFTKNVNIQGYADDINGIERLELSDDGGEIFRPLPFSKAFGKKTRVEFNVRLRTTALADGPLVYILRATDVTGLETIKSYLFYVNNHGPKLDILSPRVDEAVWDTIRVTGSVSHPVGIEKFYYEWNGEKVDIPIFPGDPYWAVEVVIPYRVYRGNTFKVTAVDMIGNTTVVQRQFRDLRKIRKPTLIIDYPQDLNNLGPDEAIYGRIAPGYDPSTIIIEGAIEELDALPSFRIPPELIPNGRGSLRIWAKASDDSLGDPVILRTNRPNVSAYSPSPTRITITQPEPYAWFRNSLTLEGRIGTEETGWNVGSLSGGRLEYRFDPTDSWKSISFNSGDGSFRTDLPVAALPEGAAHLELRTVLGGVENYPFYYPVNRFRTDPDIQFVSPDASKGPVNGLVTLSGVIYSQIPIAEIAYTTNDRTYEEVNILPAYGKYTFSMQVNFSMIAEREGKLVVRATDVSGNHYDKPLDVEIDILSDAPVVILNQPLIGQLITGDFTVSGLAFDDDGVDSIYYRIIKRPDPADSPSSTGGFPPPEVPFKKVEGNQNFEFVVSMPELTDGEHFIEVYAEDIYGFRGKVLARLIRVSTAAPVAAVTYPPISIYNKKVIYIEGSCFDANGIEEVMATLDNGLTWQRAQLMGDIRWRLSVNTAAYVDGVYSLFLKVRDKFGVESFTTALINIDNAPPDMAMAVPKNGDNVGDLLIVSARVVDNIALKSLSIHLVNIADSTIKLDYPVEPRKVVYEEISVRHLPVGEYNMRMIAVDLADNETVIARNFRIVRDNTLAEAAFYNPLPGVDHTGPLFVSGRVTGAFLPKEVTLWANRTEFAKVPVDPYGLFLYEYPAEGIEKEADVTFSVSFINPTGGVITSNDHEVRIQPYGAIVTVDSHSDGDPITGRPWLSGQAWFTDENLREYQFSGKRMKFNDQRFYDVAAVDVSYDNGRTYQRAVGKTNWKIRLETGEMARGPLPVLIRASFTNGTVAFRRLFLVVDVDAPDVRTIEPIENSLHRDILLVYGTAEDDYNLASVEVQLRPGDKAGYSVPKFIQGMFIDSNVFGATYADVSFGLSFFENNVKLSFVFGITPPDQRFRGSVFGFKLLANIVYIPLDYFFGPDWIPFSTAIAMGANFSYFTMDPQGLDAFTQEPEGGKILGALLFQWEVLRVTMVQDDPLKEVKVQWFKYFAFYIEPILWFASTDVKGAPTTVFRIQLGLRIGLL